MNDEDLRFRLRALPAEIEPARDLWPGIEARLTPRVAARPRRPRWLAPFALAASLCVALGAAWMLRPPAAGPAAASLEAEIVRREADAMTREYLAAMRQFDGAPVPGQLQPALATLDRSAADIRSALSTDPDAVFLLDQLRRTYATRLSLTQRAATG